MNNQSVDTYLFLKKKTGSAGFAIFFLCACIAAYSYAQEALIDDIRWNPEKHSLTYTLSQDAIIKVRVGEEGMVVARTLVNADRRRRGLNQEIWDGKDETGKIDITKYLNIHFCVQPCRDAEEKDLMLTISQSADTITVDLPAAQKEPFMKDGAELKVYLGSRLVKDERIQSLPYSVTLPKITQTQMLSVNVWQRPAYLSCAYGNRIIEGHSLGAGGVSNRASSSGRIAFTQRYGLYRQIWTTDFNGRNSRIITTTPVDKRYPCFSPDGTKLAYVTNTGELWLMNSDGSDNRRIELPVTCYEPKWSPDGRKLIFTSYDDISHSITKIWILDVMTQELQKIANRPFLQYSPNWSPDGKAVIFIDGPELFAQEIRKLDFATDDITQISDSPMYVYEAQPAYLGNSGRIIFSSNRSGDYDIWITRQDASEPVNLTHQPAHDTFPVSSSDGRQIYFLSDRSGTAQVWRMDSDGGNLKQITCTGNDKQDLTIWVKAE